MLLLKFFRCHLGVCRGSRMDHKALDISHIGEQGEDLQVVDEFPGVFLAAFYLEGEY